MSERQPFYLLNDEQVSSISHLKVKITVYLNFSCQAFVVTYVYKGLPQITPKKLQLLSLSVTVLQSFSFSAWSLKKNKATVSPLDDVLVFFPTKFFASKRVGPHTTVAKSLRIRDDVNEKWGLLLNPGDLVEWGWVRVGCGLVVVYFVGGIQI